MAEPPNVQHDVELERAKYPDALLDANTCGAICNAVAWKNRHLGYGVSGKTSGNHAVRYDGARISVDILHHQPTDHLIDVLISAGHIDGEKGPATPTWIDHGVNTQPDRPWLAPIPPPDATPQHGTRLMLSWFCLQRALRDWNSRAISDADYIRSQSHSGASLVRVMGHVTGGPWVEAAVDLFDPHWHDDFQRMCDEVQRRGWQCLFTFFGGDKKRAIDTMAAAVRSRRTAFRAGELVNEWLVNGWVRSDVREMVRHAAPQVDGLPLAASSPHLAHNGNPTEQQLLDDTKALYDGLPCQILTWHRNRDQGSEWNDLRNCKRIADTIGLPLWDSEPYGPGSSVSSVDDPAILSRDYQRAIEAAAEAECLHTGWGVFNGESWHPDADHTKSIQDHNNIDQILSQLGEIAITGSTSGGGGGGGGGEVPAQPYPDENSWWPQYEAQIVAAYQEAFDKGLRGSPELDPAAFRWFSRPGYSIGTGETKESAAARHLAECRAALGL
jgi:hypothetical protein